MPESEQGFTGLRYSRVWEDGAVAVDALAPGPGTSVLSICSGACNVLALALAGAGRVCAVDLNETQLALAELHLVAAAALDLDDYRCLVGMSGPDGADAPRRAGLYDAVRPGLSAGARAVWDARPGDIAFGLVHAGRLERYFRGFRDVLPAGVVDMVDAVVAAPDLTSQRPVVDALLDDGRLRSAALDYYSTEALAAGGRHAAQYAHVGVEDTGAAFFDRLAVMLRTVHAGTNVYLRLFLDATYPSDDADLPPHLGAAGHERLREVAASVELVRGDLIEVLQASEPGEFTSLYLSDMPEYHAPDEFEKMLTIAADRLRPGGRLLWWSLLEARPLPAGFAGRIVDLAADAARLHDRDRVFFYRSLHLAQLPAGGVAA